MKKKIVLFLLLIQVAFSQKSIPIDTSYSEKSVYEKVKKEYPDVGIVAPKAYRNLQEKRDIVYKKHPSHHLKLDAFYHKNKKNNPAVIVIHGGGWRSGNKNQMEKISKAIASGGYSCFSIEFRLALEAHYPAAIFDVKNAIRYIKQNARKFHVDTTKIAVLGCSSGAQMASLIGTTNKNINFEENIKQKTPSTIVQAIVNIDGILAFKHPESMEAKAASFWLGGSYEEKPDIWQQASPLSHTDKNTPPILFINSSISRFHAGRDDMTAILNKHEIYNETQIITNSPHSFWLLNPWFDDTIHYTTQFLDKIFK